METVKPRLPEVCGWDGLEDGRVTRLSTENFKALIVLCMYDTVITDICHYAFLQTHKMYNTKSKP